MNELKLGNAKELNAPYFEQTYHLNKFKLKHYL